MRLLCDEMLKGLGRWLRAAGYDTAIADGGASDRALSRVALDEERIVLTCDRALAARVDLAGLVVALVPAGLDAAARELRERLGIDWLHAPFTRCLLDNTPLRPAARDERARLPEAARSGAGPARCCPACGRVYWRGSHVRRMQVRLERWQAG